MTGGSTFAHVNVHVLVAEDDRMQAEVIRRYLVGDGYQVTVVHDGGAALEAVRDRHLDLVILDVMMPGPDGLQVCRMLRRESEVPVLMLTARTTEEDLLVGLDTGADDYLKKPYSPRELTARVRNLLRRTRPRPGLVVDPRQRVVTVDGEPVEITRGEFEVLAALAARPGQVYTREQLVERASHAYDRYPTLRSIDVHVRNLRSKLEDDPANPRYLVTVFGVGYKLADGR